jgi:hypothetical protein
MLHIVTLHLVKIASYELYVTGFRCVSTDLRDNPDKNLPDFLANTKTGDGEISHDKTAGKEKRRSKTEEHACTGQGTDLFFVVGGGRRLTFPLRKAPVRPRVHAATGACLSPPSDDLREEVRVLGYIWYHGDDLLLPFSRAEETGF